MVTSGTAVSLRGNVFLVKGFVSSQDRDMKLFIFRVKKKKR